MIGYVYLSYIVVENGLKEFRCLKSLRISGKCPFMTSDLADSKRHNQTLGSLNSISLTFSKRFGAYHLIEKCANLSEITIQDGDPTTSFHQRLRGILTQFKDSLQRLDIDSMGRNAGTSGPEQKEILALLANCTKLTHIHLPFSSDVWAAVSGLTTLTSLGLTFGSPQQQQLAMANSKDLEDLQLYCKLSLVCHDLGGLYNLYSFDLVIGKFILKQEPKEGLYSRLPRSKIKRIRMSIKSSYYNHIDSIAKCLQTMAYAFPNLEELILDQALMRKEKAGDFLRQVEKSKQASFKHLKKLTLPFNSEDPIYRMCPNVVELTFTWNDDVTEENIFQGMLPDVLKFYRGQIERLILEQNEWRAFVIPDMILWRIQDHCRNSRILLRGKESVMYVTKISIPDFKLPYFCQKLVCLECT